MVFLSENYVFKVVKWELDYLVPFPAVDGTCKGPFIFRPLVGTEEK